MNAAQKSWETRRRNLGLLPAPPKRKLPKQEPIVMPKKVNVVSGNEMMNRCVILLVTINGIGNYRKVDPNSINITDAQTDKEVNKAWMGVHRKLMDAPELKKIQSIGNKAKAYVSSRALPYSLKVGIYLLPSKFQEEMDAKLEEFKAEMKPYIKSLADRLPEYKKEAKSQQGPQFNEKQFPTADYIRSAFNISWRFLFIDSAKGLTKALYEKERKKAEREWAETRDVIQQALRAQLAEMVSHMVDKLTPVNGLRKIFHASSIDHLNEFLATFDARNITNDVQMKVLVDKAKRLVADSCNYDTLRTDEEARDYARHGFETIKLLLEPMVVNKPKRMLSFED